MRRPFTSSKSGTSLSGTFRWLVAGMFLLAVAVRWFVFLRWYRYLPIGEINDNVYYHVTANLLADGHGFANPFEYITLGRIQRTAGHPPGFTVYLSIWSFLGLDSVTWHRLAGGFISASAGDSDRPASAPLVQRTHSPYRHGGDNRCIHPFG